MKYNVLILFSCLFSLLFISCSNQNEYNIRDFGASSNTSQLNTKAIQNAIDQCHQNNGGTVIIPEGTFYTGTIELKSNVNLHLEEGAVLLASTNVNDYVQLDVDYPSYGRNYGGHKNGDPYKRFAFIIAHKASNIAITGKGIIDGNGGNGEAFRVTVDSTGKWHKPYRPRLVNFITCNQILVRDVTLQFCQNWNLHLENSENIEVDGISILGHANANDDGIDINSCRNVTIRNSSVDVGDDALVFKTLGANNNENILVEHCTFASETRCIQFGSETEGDMKNIRINHVTLHPTAVRPEWPEKGAKPWSKLVKRRLGAGISMNTNDGGTIDNVTFNNITIAGIPSPIYLHSAQRQWLYSEGRFDTTMHPGTIKNVTINNLKATGVPGTANSTIMGMDGFPLENITLNNIEIQHAGSYNETKTQLNYLEDKTEHCGWPGFWGKETYYPAKGAEFRNVKGLMVKNFKITSKNDPRPTFILKKCKQVTLNGQHFNKVTQKQEVH